MMRTGKAARTLSAAVCALLWASMAVPASASARPAGASTAPHWRIDRRLPLDLTVGPSQNPTGYSFLDVESVGPHDAWAVGVSGLNDLFFAHPVLRHWHDDRWLTPNLPAWLSPAAPGAWVNELEAVGGSSPTDVWAMGTLVGQTSSFDRVVHWNGHIWTRASLPTSSPFAPLITSIVATSKSNAWAAGCYCEASQSPYLAHYTRGRWRNVTPANLPFGAIDTVVAVSPTSLWAIQTDANQRSAHLLHYNGVRWSVMSMPQSLVSGTDRFFAGGGIVATAQGGVWLAGAVGVTYLPAVVHLDKGRWTISKVKAASYLATLVSDGHGGMWSASWPVGTISAQIWHYAAGRWRHSPNPAGIHAPYRVTWMAVIPRSRTVLGIGVDVKNELLLSYR